MTGKPLSNVEMRKARQALTSMEEARGALTLGRGNVQQDIVRGGPRSMVAYQAVRELRSSLVEGFQSKAMTMGRLAQPLPRVVHETGGQRTLHLSAQEAADAWPDSVVTGLTQAYGHDPRLLAGRVNMLSHGASAQLVQGGHCGEAKQLTSMFHSQRLQPQEHLLHMSEMDGGDHGWAQIVEKRTSTPGPRGVVADPWHQDKTFMTPVLIEHWKSPHNKPPGVVLDLNAEEGPRLNGYASDLHRSIQNHPTIPQKVEHTLDALSSSPEATRRFNDVTSGNRVPDVYNGTGPMVKPEFRKEAGSAVRDLDPTGRPLNAEGVGERRKLVQDSTTTILRQMGLPEDQARRETPAHARVFLDNARELTNVVPVSTKKKFLKVPIPFTQETKLKLAEDVGRRHQVLPEPLPGSLLPPAD